MRNTALSTLFASLLLCSANLHPTHAANLPRPSVNWELYSTGSGMGHFQKPWAMASSPDGRLYVAHDGPSPHILIVDDSVGVVQDTIPFATYGPYSLAIDAMVVSSDTTLWIMDGGGFLESWKNGTATMYSSLGLGGSLPDLNLLGLAASPRYLYLAASTVFPGQPYSDGTGIARYTTPGLSNKTVFATKWHVNECQGNITAMATDIDDNVYIITEYSLSSTCASGAPRYTDLRQFSSTGDTLSSWRLPNSAHGYYGLFVDRAGIIYFGDGGAVRALGADSVEKMARAAELTGTDATRCIPTQPAESSS